MVPFNDKFSINNNKELKIVGDTAAAPSTTAAEKENVSPLRFSNFHTNSSMVAGNKIAADKSKTELEKKSHEDTNSCGKVIIVGAGIAGLTNAVELTEKGVQVVLVEARETSGGRVRNYHMKGVDLPEGPAWIYGGAGEGQGPIAEKYGIGAQKTNPLISALDATKATRKAVKTAADTTRKEYNFASGVVKETRNVDFVHPSPVKKIGNFNCSLNELLRCCELLKNEKKNRKIIELIDPRIVKFATRILQARKEAEAGVSFEIAEKLNKLYEENKVVAEELYTHSCYGEEGVDEYTLDGFDRLVPYLFDRALKTGLLTLHDNTVASRIDATSQKPKVYTNKGEYEGDAVICAVPLAVLQKGKVTLEGLNPKKLQAFKGFQMARQVKIFLEFKDCFWENRGDHVTVLNSNENERAMFKYENATQCIPKEAAKPNILIASFYAKDAEGLDSKKMVEEAMIPLRAAYKGVKGYSEPMAWHVADLNKDPYVLGSWPVPGEDFEHEHIQSLMEADPDDRLFLSGDYCVPLGMMGTVTGAYHSGLIVSEQVEKALKVDLAQTTKVAIKETSNEATKIMPSKRRLSN